MSPNQIVARAKAEVLREASSMLDGGTSAARMLARMAGEFEAIADTTAPTTGAELIASERQRQVEQEGWTPEHDDQHNNGVLADAAACYALRHGTGLPADQWSTLWPWDSKWWKPKDAIRDLVRAGAMIAAEIDRRQRLSNPSSDK